jgi:hypothetical protein
MKPLFEDPYGQMKYAALEIRGLTRRVTPVTRSFPFKSRFLPSLRLEEPVSGLVGEARLDPDFDFDKYRLNLDGQSVNKTTGLLALLLGRWDTGFPFDPPVLRGLLLEHADDGQRYERRGTFTIKPPPLRTGEHGRVSCCYEQESRWDENVNSESIKKGFDGTWEGWRTETVVII